MSHPDNPQLAAHLAAAKARGAERAVAQAADIDHLSNLLRVAAHVSGNPAVVMQIAATLTEIMPQMPPPSSPDLAASLALLGIPVDSSLALPAAPEKADAKWDKRRGKKPKEVPYEVVSLEEILGNKEVWVMHGESRYLSLNDLAKLFDGKEQDVRKRKNAVNYHLARYSNSHQLDTYKPSPKKIYYSEQTVKSFLAYFADKAKVDPNFAYTVVLEPVKKN